jgi:hypothetical protein
MSDVKETTFRVMMTAHVWWKERDITMMRIDQVGVGYLPGDGITHSAKNMINHNADALLEAALICALRIAQAKTQAEKDALAQTFFDKGNEVQVQQLVEGGEPSVIPDKHDDKPESD